MSREQSFNATHALVFHELQGGSSRSMHQRAAVITSHPVTVGAQGPVIGPGHTLSAQDESRLLDVLTRNVASNYALLPENVLAVGANRLLWFVPGRVRTMIVRVTGTTRRLMVPWPTLLFEVADGVLRLAALASNRRPEPETAVYHAPVANVYADCRVCTGSASLPDTASVADIPGWEASIYETAFTHTNHDRTLRLAVGDRGEEETVSNDRHFAFWSSLQKEAASVFPVDALVPVEMSLQEWMGDAA